MISFSEALGFAYFSVYQSSLLVSIHKPSDSTHCNLRLHLTCSCLTIQGVAKKSNTNFCDSNEAQINALTCLLNTHRTQLTHLKLRRLHEKMVGQNFWGSARDEVTPPVWAYLHPKFTKYICGVGTGEISKGWVADQ